MLKRFDQLVIIKWDEFVRLSTIVQLLKIIQISLSIIEKIIPRIATQFFCKAEHCNTNSRNLWRNIWQGTTQQLESFRSSSELFLKCARAFNLRKLRKEASFFLHPDMVMSFTTTHKVVEIVKLGKDHPHLVFPWRQEGKWKTCSASPLVSNACKAQWFSVGCCKKLFKWLPLGN